MFFFAGLFQCDIRSILFKLTSTDRIKNERSGLDCSFVFFFSGMKFHASKNSLWQILNNTHINILMLWLIKKL